MLGLMKQEAQNRGIDFKDINSISDISELVDLNLINKIDEYKEVSDKLDAEVKDTNALARMKPMDHNLQKAFKNLMKDQLSENL